MIREENDKRHENASYGTYGVSFDSLTPQQQEVIIDYCRGESDEQTEVKF